MPLSGMAGTLKVSRQHQRQPSIGSIKSALEQLNARVGDTAFLRFTGSEGAITSAAITIERRGTSTRDPFAEALALVGCQGEVDDPFEAINAALGVDVEFAADLVEVATRRKDSELAAVLAQIAAI
jgi:peptidoglycan hydrolase-like protein with peptidoglycan-binding domain